LRRVSPKDHLWLHIRDLPYFRGLLRAVEARFYEEIDLPGPVLDIGCGDGHFAAAVFDAPLDVGLDPWWAPLREAGQRGSYRGLTRAAGDSIPFPDGAFGSVISNSVLEHIPEVEAVLADMSRVLRPGGVMAFCVPNDHFSGNLSIGRAFDRLGWRAAGDAYRRFFNRIARHVHLDGPEVWTRRLAACDMEIEAYWHYYAPDALHVTEWGHYFGAPAWIVRQLTGRWLLAPTRWNLGWLYALLRPYYTQKGSRRDGPQSGPETGVCTFYVARKRGD
jgi:SAM-dependent methyltransferase